MVTNYSKNLYSNSPIISNTNKNNSVIAKKNKKKRKGANIKYSENNFYGFIS